MSTVPRKQHSPRKHALALGLGALLGLSLAQPALGWSVEEAAAPYKGSELKVGSSSSPTASGTQRATPTYIPGPATSTCS